VLFARDFQAGSLDGRLPPSFMVRRWSCIFLRNASVEHLGL
jgi:hypothetical protein